MKKYYKPVTTIEFMNLFYSISDKENDKMEDFNPILIVSINEVEKEVKEVIFQDKKAILVVDE